MSRRPYGYTIDAQHNIKPAYSFEEMSECLTNEKLRRVDQTVIGTIWVSTVFLCIDHNFSGKGPSTLFETMIFNDDGPMEEHYCTRCSTWDKAVKMHAIGVAWARELVAKADKQATDALKVKEKNDC